MALDKRKNVAAFPVTLWTDRWDSSSQFHTLFFLTWMLGGGEEDELPKWIWRDVEDNTLNATQSTKGTTSHPKPPNSSKLSQHFLNSHTWEGCSLLWFSGQNSLVIVLLRLLCRAASPISTARHWLIGCLNPAPGGSWCRSCDVQKIQSSQALASWSLLTSHLLRGGGSKPALPPPCSCASDLTEMGVLTDHGTTVVVLILMKYTLILMKQWRSTS